MIVVNEDPHSSETLTPDPTNDTESVHSALKEQRSCDSDFLNQPVLRDDSMKLLYFLSLSFIQSKGFTGPGTSKIPRLITTRMPAKPARLEENVNGVIYVNDHVSAGTYICLYECMYGSKISRISSASIVKHALDLLPIHFVVTRINRFILSIDNRKQTTKYFEPRPPFGPVRWLRSD